MFRVRSLKGACDRFSRSLHHFFGFFDLLLDFEGSLERVRVCVGRRVREAVRVGPAVLLPVRLGAGERLEVRETGTA